MSGWRGVALALGFAVSIILLALLTRHMFLKGEINPPQRIVRI